MPDASGSSSSDLAGWSQSWASSVSRPTRYCGQQARSMLIRASALSWALHLRLSCPVLPPTGPELTWGSVLSVWISQPEKRPVRPPRHPHPNGTTGNPAPTLAREHGPRAPCHEEDDPGGAMPSRSPHASSSAVARSRPSLPCSICSPIRYFQARLTSGPGLRPRMRMISSPVNSGRTYSRATHCPYPILAAEANTSPVWRLRCTAFGAHRGHINARSARKR